jgi:hypothetical protein
LDVSGVILSSFKNRFLAKAVLALKCDDIFLAQGIEALSGPMLQPGQGGMVAPAAEGDVDSEFLLAEGEVQHPREAATVVEYILRRGHVQDVSMRNSAAFIA